MRNVVIASAVRTPGGKFGGTLKDMSAVDLGALVISEVVKRAGISPEVVDQVILGNGWQAGVGPNPARICTVKGGLPHKVPAFTVNIRCGSGLRCVELGALSIAAGETDIVIAGGTESASNAPFVSKTARFGARMGDTILQDVLHKDGFMCPLAEMMMGGTGEVLAEEFNITRQEQDQFALESHQKAVKAQESGGFEEETMAIEVKTRKGIITFNSDEIPRVDTTLEKLGTIKPNFKKDGTVTAGNSSALCDGASAVLLMEEEKAKIMGVKPLARILSYSFVAIDPAHMGISPVKAIPEALEKAGLKMEDIDLFEINEAFAVQVLACNRTLNIPSEKLNVHGGAIALGHPVGATGSKILTTLVHALKRYQKRYGVVCLCIGGGQGVAMVIESI